MPLGKQPPLISVCIISLGRETIYRTLESIFMQKIGVPFEVVIVLQGTLNEDRIKELNGDNISVKIRTYDHGLGFGYYRNQAIEASKGDVLVWIDDDEWCGDENWLEILTKAIRSGKDRVVTSGYRIELRQGYWSDCISLLGWPGGGAVGFKGMWNVSRNGRTKHLCTGNFAIETRLITELGGFNESATHGAEDNDLSARLGNAKVAIRYVEGATVYHVARGLRDLIPWGIRRGQALANRSSQQTEICYEESSREKIKRLCQRLFLLDRYLPGKLVVFSILLVAMFLGKMR